MPRFAPIFALPAWGSPTAAPTPARADLVRIGDQIRACARRTRLVIPRAIERMTSP